MYYIFCWLICCFGAQNQVLLTVDGLEKIKGHKKDEKNNIIDGSLRVRYIYDSWGNTLSVQDGNGQEITSENDIGNLNPFRYRGYYFDSDTGLYYLQNRYYDPQTCRFVNADGVVSGIGDSVQGYNIFAIVLITQLIWATNREIGYSG